MEGWQRTAERAPSLIRADRPQVARWLAVPGLICTTLGLSAQLAAALGRPYLISPAWGMALLVPGLGLLLLHASNEKELQYRRVYGMVGALLLFLGLVLRVLPVNNVVGGAFLPYGAASMSLALLFLMAFARNETDPFLHTLCVRGVGLTGLLLAVVAFAASNIGTENFTEAFLLRDGVVMALLGLWYLSSFIGLQAPGGETGYWIGLGIGVLGFLVFALALARSALPSLLYGIGWLSSRPTTGYLMPSGLVLIGLGLLYLIVSIGICSDRTFIVLMRRELAAYFYSPIAYLLFVGLTAVGWYMFVQFVGGLSSAGDQGLFEPIVRDFIFGLFPVICVIFIVPVLTMRLLSEEQRMGTLEVLLTAPLNESAVVLSKFTAALTLFLLMWVPWCLYLVALRVMNAEEFDYRPLLSFFISLVFSGAGFVAMGLFFSCLTRNQIIAAVLAFVGMIGFTSVYLVKFALPALRDGTWNEVLTYVSYIDLWVLSLQGQLAPRFLLFHLSAAVFFLFLSIKVLESRKWS
jgi:ABC-type transport system involved in multi-copper enzyme maturation permease subunit